MSKTPEVTRVSTRQPVEGEIVFRAVGSPKPGHTSTATLSLTDGKPHTLHARIQSGSGNFSNTKVPLHELDSLIAVLKAAQEELAEGRHE